MTVGFVGLGAMGGRIVGHLLHAGHQVAVTDIQEDVVNRLCSAGARRCESARAVGDVAELVFVSLPSPEAVEQVALGDSGLCHGKATRLHVDLSTTGARVAERVAEGLDRHGVQYLDAPVSGGAAGAEAGTLTVMAAGAREAFEQVQPILEIFAKKIIYVGNRPGQGQTAKVLNNLLSATAIAITSEAMAVGVKSGIKAEVLLDVFNSSSGRNTATSDKFPKHVLTGSFATDFRLSLMAKDVAIGAAAGREAGIPMIVGGIVEQLWRLAEATGRASADCTEIVHLVERWSGVEIRGEKGG